MPLRFDETSDEHWKMLIKAIVSPQGNEGKMLWNKASSLRVQPGYQYDLGRNFPCQYTKLKDSHKEQQEHGSSIDITEDEFAAENKKQATAIRASKMKQNMRIRFTKMLLEKQMQNIVTAQLKNKKEEMKEKRRKSRRQRKERNHNS